MGIRGERPPIPIDSITCVNADEVLTEREMAAQIRQEMRRLERERQEAKMREERKRRKPFPKSVRKAVYEKYGGHCAYCGCELDYRDMQVDHAVAVNGGELSDQMVGDDTMNKIDNLMPACRQCNYYKSTLDIEGFRWKIREVLQHSCINTFQARLAMKYGIVTFNEWDGKFFFESLDKE